MPEAIQETVATVRSIADMQRCFPLSARRVLVMRGNDDQMALAAWLLKQFDGPAGRGTTEFKLGGAGGQIAQVAYVNAGTRESLLGTVSAIRTETKMQRLYPVHARSAVVMRGTAEQLAQAQQVIQARQGK